MIHQHDISDEIVWRPSRERIERSNLKHFMRQHQIQSFKELLHKSTNDVAWFTEAILQYLEIEFQEPYSNVVDLCKGIQMPVWCVDGKLNIAHNCVDKWSTNVTHKNNLALIWEGEEGTCQTLTYHELAIEVNRCSNALRSLGFSKGDVIAIYMPMIPETAIALLSIAKIGCIALPLFSGYGPGAINSRLKHTDAKGLFTADGCFRKGKLIDLKHTADSALKSVSSIKHVIVVRRSNNSTDMLSGRDYWWHEIVPCQPNKSPLEPTDAEDPIMIIYTSGTTGNPKGAVHTHCGFPIKAAQDIAFGLDIHSGDVLYWITDMGWMMGPWMVFGSTVLGATICMYDGAPDYPGPDRTWKLVQKHKINVLGLSPTFVKSMIAHGKEPVDSQDLSSLNAIGSTGEPWNPAPWKWLFEVVCKGTRPIINYSGGTEISGGIVMDNPLLPLKPAAFSAPCPGIAADILDTNVMSVKNQVGELVIRKPWIGMTRGFWRDNDKYLDTYWSSWNDIWVHGDWGMVDTEGHWYILGRSDDTINIAGKRLGPSEVESVLVNHPAVVEAAAIGVPSDIKGNDLVCYCVLSPGNKSSVELQNDLQTQIINELGKPLKPKKIKFVTDLPKTRNGKVMRRIIRAAHLNTIDIDYDNIVNPEAVEEILSAV